MLLRCWINSPPLHLPECEWSSSPSGRSSALDSSASWTDYSLRISCDWGTSVQMDGRTGVRPAPSPEKRSSARIMLMIHRHVLTSSLPDGHDCVRSHDFLPSEHPSQPLALRAVPRASGYSRPGRWRRAEPCIISGEDEKESQWKWTPSARA